MLGVCHQTISGNGGRGARSGSRGARARVPRRSATLSPAAGVQAFNIASYFITSSPTGEVAEVVRGEWHVPVRAPLTRAAIRLTRARTTPDVKVLVAGTATLSDPNLTRIMRDYNTSHFVWAPAPDGTGSVVVSPFGEVDPSGRYLDPRSGKVLQFDHLKGAFTGETDQKQVLGDRIAKIR
jgi:hypothetical protein